MSTRLYENDLETRSIRPQESDRSYQRARKQMYPLTYDQPSVSKEATDAWDGYHKPTKDANKSRESYSNELNKAQTMFKSFTTPEEKSYYKRRTGSLFPSQHKELVEGAFETSQNHLMTAKSRHDFLNEFPHGYKTLKGRKVHEDLRDMAIKRADEYEMKAKKHVEYASDPAISGSRDKYGRLRPAYQSPSPPPDEHLEQASRDHPPPSTKEAPETASDGTTANSLPSTSATGGPAKVARGETPLTST